MAVVPASHTFGATTATSSEQNTYVRDPIAFLLNPPRAELAQITTAQSFTSATFTPVTFNSEILDTDIDGIGGHDNVTNPSRYTARYAGWYLISGGVTFSSNATGIRFAWLRVNGTDVPGTVDGAQAAAGANDSPAVCRAKKVFLNVGDYVELIGYQNSGVPLTVNVSGNAQPSFSILWVSN